MGLNIKDVLRCFKLFECMMFFVCEMCDLCILVTDVKDFILTFEFKTAS
jgi:hypothetical protein